jgi:acetyl-CoA carboxylase carboxyltransferase component
MTLIPDKPIRVYDQYQVIKQIVDDGKYFAIKPNFGRTLITCLARMNGRTVGIIANQTLYNAGAAGPDECDKATDFITLCDTFNIPLIFLADTPGHLVGRPAEQKRIPTKIMVWMEAMAFSTVPKICIIIRKAYGMAISNMCGTNCGPDFIAAMTTSEISFMSAEAAANVVYLRRIESSPNPEEERARLIKQMELESSPFPAAAVGLLDDVIDPRDTRKYIIDRLEFLRKCKGNFISETRLQSWPTGL